MKIKRILSLLTGTVMMFSATFGMSKNHNTKSFMKQITTEAAASDFTAEQAVAWANNCASTKWDKDVDGAYGTQCVDLILAYYSYLGVSRSKGNATDYQTNTLPSGWKRVKSSPQPGDVIVWAGNTKINSSYTLSKYGHVGIVVAVSGNKLTTVETNADLNVSYAQKKSRDASYAACFIRPNFSGTAHTCTNMTTGEYYLKNSSTNTYMQAASASNEAKVSLAAKKETANFMFNLTGNTSEGYYLETKSNAGFVVNPYSNTPTSGTVINIYKKVDDGTQNYSFDKSGSGYIIHLRNNSDLCLTADGTGVVLKNRTGAANQIWILESNSSVAVKFHRNISSSDTYTVTETFTVGVSNQKFGYKTDGTGRYSYMNEPNVGFGEWVNPGYELLGWSADKNATEASYKTYSAVIDSWIQKNAPSINFYAVWKKSELDSISVSTPPSAVIYENGSSFNKDGMVVTAKYACGSTKVVTDYEISYDFSKTGTVNVTISYTEDGITKTTVQEVTIHDLFEGSGTESSPYLVKTAADLENVAKMVNNPLANGCYGHASYKQTADIDLSAYSNWTPIGVYNVDAAAKKNNPKAIFRGVYNGNYHKITNLTVDTNGLNAGLFGRLNYTVDETTVIENLSVSGNITGQTFPNNEYAGGIAGVAGDGAIIRNCDFTGTVNGTDHVGGIAGKLHNGGTIENCYVNATISSATGNVGGICGTVSSGEYAVSYDATVKNCYFAGELADGKSIGGISGMNVKGDKSANIITYKNNYYLNSAASGGVAGAAQGGCTGLISSQLKTIAVDLGAPFVENTNVDLNDGYPVFEWQLRIFGDTNCDGNVYLNDAVLILQYLGNPDEYQLSAEGLAAADVSGNGDGITNKDALAIQRFVLHIIPSLPES